MVVYMK